MRVCSDRLDRGDALHVLWQNQPPVSETYGAHGAPATWVDIPASGKKLCE